VEPGLAEKLNSEDLETLPNLGVPTVQLMLMLQAGHYLEEEGKRWLRERMAEVSDMEAKVERLSKRVQGRLGGDDTFIEIHQLLGVLASTLQSLDSVVVGGADSAMRGEVTEFKGHVGELLEKLEGVKRKM
jgi:hypothetical protein